MPAKAPMAPKAMPKPAAKTAPIVTPAPAPASSSRVCMDGCNKLLTDTDAMINKMKCGHPCVAKPACQPKRTCADECKEHANLSVALDTSCLNKAVEHTKKAAERPIENPLKKEECEKKPNECLSKLMDTRCLSKKVEAAKEVAGTV